MKYMIHTCNARNWYVQQYLIPSMLQQGIKETDIIVWRDKDNKGNLQSTLESFESLPKKGYTWHLQDDVIISSDFKERTEAIEYDLCAGYCSNAYDVLKSGTVAAADMWYSFQCMKIPNKLALEFVSWVQLMSDIQDPKCFIWIVNNKFDDSLFKEFLTRKHKELIALNIEPNLVDNIDYLIGGSVISKREEIFKSTYFREPELVEQLKKRLMQ